MLGSSSELTTPDFKAHGLVGLLYGDPDSRRAAIEREPGLVNVLGMEAEWSRKPETMDYLSPDSPYYWLKQLSTRLYLDFVQPLFDDLAPESRALEAGCGIGRLATHLAPRFSQVISFDPCYASLSAYAGRLAKRAIGNVELVWADLTWLDEVPPDRFDLVIALELICYCADPLGALRRLVRVARPGAQVIVSVEALPGALAVRGAEGLAALSDALEGQSMVQSDEEYVIGFDRSGLQRLCADAGLVDVRIQRSHYFGEGPLWQALDDERLCESDYLEEVLQAERTLRTDPRVSSWSRVLTAAGTATGPGARSNSD